MSDLLFNALIVYVVVAGIWLVLALMNWGDAHSDGDDPGEAARWVLKAPLWPWFAGRMLGQLIGVLATDAARGRRDE